MEDILRYQQIGFYAPNTLATRNDRLSKPQPAFTGDEQTEGESL